MNLGRPAQPGAPSAVPTPWLLGALACALAISAQRLTVAPGYEIYAGTFFSVLVCLYRGRRLGCLAAAVFMAPSIFWWGHPFSVLSAVLMVWLLPPLIRLTKSVTLAVAAFHLTFGIAFAYFLILRHYETTLAIAGFLEFKKALNDMAAGALAGLVHGTLEGRSRFPFIGLRYRLRLIRVTENATSLFGLLAVTMILTNEAREFNRRVGDAVQIATAELALLSRLPVDDGGAGRVTVANGLVEYAVTNGSTPDRAAAMARLQCRNVVSRTAGEDPRTFNYWSNACLELKSPRGVDAPYLLISLRSITQAAYGGILGDATGAMALLLIVIFWQRWLSGQIHYTSRAWTDTIERVGSPDLEARRDIRLQEFAVAIDRFIAANNQFTSARQREELLTNTVRDLQAGLSLRLIANIHFDRNSGILQFDEIGLDRQSAPVAMVLPPADRATLGAHQDQSDVTLELRLNRRDENEWSLLLAHQLKDSGQWARGCVVRLRQAQFFQERMLQQARLVDLGGMASALSHELKQPLFTIALAAENAQFALEQQKPNAAAEVVPKLQRILEQIDRAKAIIERIGRYSRVGVPGEAETLCVADVINNVERFMRPLLYDENVDLQIDPFEADTLHVRMAQVGLEQVLVNGIQNAVDAINARRRATGDRERGRIRLWLALKPQACALNLEDDGIGLDAELGSTFFNAFVTSKAPGEGTGLGLYVSHQMVMEAGGSLTLHGRADGTSGAVLTVMLPLAPEERQRAAPATAPVLPA